MTKGSGHWGLTTVGFRVFGFRIEDVGVQALGFKV